MSGIYGYILKQKPVVATGVWTFHKLVVNRDSVFFGSDPFPSTGTHFIIITRRTRQMHTQKKIIKKIPTVRRTNCSLKPENPDSILDFPSSRPPMALVTFLRFNNAAIVIIFTERPLRNRQAIARGPLQPRAAGSPESPCEPPHRMKQTALAGGERREVACRIKGKLNKKKCRSRKNGAAALFSEIGAGI